MDRRQFQRSEVVSPVIDLIDDDFSEDDDNDGVPMREADEGVLERSNLQEDDCSLNIAYKNHLRELIQVIKAEIQQCQEKQVMISRRIKILENQPVNPVTRKNWYHLFGIPYFKDVSFFPCPMNEDQWAKRKKQEIDYHRLEPIRRWAESDCLKLERGVRCDVIEKKTSGFLEQRCEIMEELKDPKLPKKKCSELHDKMRKIESSIKRIKTTDFKVLVGGINDKHDWLKIACVEFGDQRCSEEIEAMWKLCRHPSINRKHWTRSENETLRALVKKHKEQDWAVIASELKTNRSEFQCMIQYQRNLNTSLLNNRWTEEEDEILKYLVETTQINDYVPWGTISMCMKSRTRAQIYNRWMFSINPIIKKGRFSEKEDCLILAGVKHFGEDFSRIAELLPGRNSAQIACRYKNCLARDGPLGGFSADEDVQLIKLVETYGKDWKGIVSDHLVTRTRSQVRHRYQFLEDWLSKNPDSSVTKAPRRDLGDYKKRNANLWSAIQNALKTSNKKGEREKITKEDMELLKVTMSPMVAAKRLQRNCGRRKKVSSKADVTLQNILRPCYLLPTGRIKAVFTGEEIQKRENLMENLISALQARFAFPFDTSVILDDPDWNEGDQKILLALKEKYDKGNFEEEREGNTMIKQQAGISQSLMPFYRLENNIKPSLPENFPAFIRNVIGLRTVLLSRDNIRMWKAKTPGSEQDFSLPSLRPASEAFHNKGKKCFTKEECAKLFSKRLFSLFYWPVLLARVPPEFENSELIQPDSETSQSGQPPPKKRKKVFKQSCRAKRLLMKERWKTLREQNANKMSERGNSSLKSAAKAKKKESDLSMA